VLRYVKPQHFLPVHGEYAFLCEHARLARERAGVNFTEVGSCLGRGPEAKPPRPAPPGWSLHFSRCSAAPSDHHHPVLTLNPTPSRQVIRNGQMLGVHERRNRNTISTGSLAAAQAAAEKERSRLEVLGEVPLVNFYNDGGRGTGTAQVRRGFGVGPRALHLVSPLVGVGRPGCYPEAAGWIRRGCPLARLRPARALCVPRTHPPLNPHSPHTHRTRSRPQEMALPERASLAFEGVVVAAVDVYRAPPGGRGAGAPPPEGTLRAKVRITTRGMWLDKGRFLDAFHEVRGGPGGWARFGPGIEGPDRPGDVAREAPRHGV
jgi:hypothetical protein